jgi:hypothetical protein
MDFIDIQFSQLWFKCWKVLAFRKSVRSMMPIHFGRASDFHRSLNDRNRLKIYDSLFIGEMKFTYWYVSLWSSWHLMKWIVKVDTEKESNIDKMNLFTLKSTLAFSYIKFSTVFGDFWPIFGILKDFSGFCHTQRQSINARSASH